MKHYSNILIGLYVKREKHIQNNYAQKFPCILNKGRASNIRTMMDKDAVLTYVVSWISKKQKHLKRDGK